MAYITKEDITKSLHAEYLDEITRGDDLIINASIDASIIEMKGYLLARYDVASIFSKSGDNRNALLVEFCVDIAIYNIIDIDRPGIIMEDRRERYKRAIDWLKQVNNGNINTDLPFISIETKNKISYGSNLKRKSHY